MLRSGTLTIASALVAIALAVVWSFPFGLQQRIAVQYDRTPWPASALGVATPLVELAPGTSAWFKTSNSRWGDRTLQVISVAGNGAVEPPPGVMTLPDAGEMVVSPELRQLIDSDASSALQVRLPGQVVGVIGDPGLVSGDELIAYVGTPIDSLSVTGEALGGWGDPFAPPAAMGGSGVVLVGFVAAAFAVPMLYLLIAASKALSDRRNKRLATLTLLGAGPSQLSSVVVGETAPFLAIGAAVGLVSVRFVGPVIVGFLPRGARFRAEILTPGAEEIMLILGIFSVLAVAAGHRTSQMILNEPITFSRDIDRQRLDLWWIVVWLSGMAATWGAVQFPELLARGNRFISGIAFVGVIAAVVAVGPVIRIFALAAARAASKRFSTNAAIDVGLHRLAWRGAAQLRVSAVVALLLVGVAVSQAVFPVLAAAQGSIESRAMENARDAVVVARTERPVPVDEVRALLPAGSQIGSISLVTASTADATIEAWVASCDSLNVLLEHLPACSAGMAFVSSGVPSDVHEVWIVEGLDDTYQPTELAAGVPRLLASHDLLIVAHDGPVRGDSIGLLVIEGAPPEAVREALWLAPTAFGERGTVATLREMLDDDLEMFSFYDRTVNVVVAMGLALSALGVVLVSVTAAIESRRQAAFLWAIGVPHRTNSVANFVRSIVPTILAAFVGCTTGFALGLAYLHFATGGGEPLEPSALYGYDLAAAIKWAVAAVAIVVASSWAADKASLRNLSITDLRTE